MSAAPTATKSWGGSQKPASPAAVLGGSGPAREHRAAADSDDKPKTKGKRNVRSKYSRPCDGCALRKVRCDQKKPCNRCREHNVPCTDNRLRKKCGPKHLHAKTRDSINSLAMGNCKINTLGTYDQILTLDKLLPCLQVYQTWFYGIWPVLSVAHLVSRIVQLNPSSDSALSSENATNYSLCCAVCAAITRQLAFLSSRHPIVGVPCNIEASQYAQEAIRARTLFDYRLEPTHDNLLISFFLYIYYVNVKGGTNAAVLYMKEAISIAQLLGLHDPRTYVKRPAAEVHRLRKIYYMLLVTERFMCIEDNVPVCLEPSIPLPALEDEEYSSLLTGFIELVKIFSIPDKKFFDNLINFSKKTPSNLGMFYNLFQSSGTPTRKWIASVQAELKKIEVTNVSSDTQRLNILLSKHWMRALAWHISSQNGLLIKKAASEDEVCLTAQFPIQIAKDFLLGTEDLPLFAFESNGPGVCVKLLELANAVADSVNESIINKSETFTAYNLLTSIFGLVSKLKSEITISQELYLKIENIVNKKSANSALNIGKSYIREVNADGESIVSGSLYQESPKDFSRIMGAGKLQSGAISHSNSASDLKYFEPSLQLPLLHHFPFSPANMQSPFNQMNLGFGMSPTSANPGFENTATAPAASADNVNSEFYSKKHFQTLPQVQSPSEEQLQQLELQLQLQFSHFQPNQFNQYQYHSPGSQKSSHASEASSVQNEANVVAEKEKPEKFVESKATDKKQKDYHGLSGSPGYSDTSSYVAGFSGTESMAEQINHQPINVGASYRY